MKHLQVHRFSQGDFDKWAWGASDRTAYSALGGQPSPPHQPQLPLITNTSWSTWRLMQAHFIVTPPIQPCPQPLFYSCPHKHAILIQSLYVPMSSVIYLPHCCLISEASNSAPHKHHPVLTFIFRCILNILICAQISSRHINSVKTLNYQ